MTEQERKQRRERIATAAMQGALSGGMIVKIEAVAEMGEMGAENVLALIATTYADALIAELDKEEE